MPISVYGLTKSDVQADTLVTSLMSAGFRFDDISVLFPENLDPRHFNNEIGSNDPAKVPDGIETGGVLGGALGWMIGIGAMAIPGVGSFIVAGPIMAVLGGAAIGATIGGVSGVLIGMGMSELNAKHYEDRINEWNILIIAHADNGEWACRARNIFESIGINDVRSSGKTDSDIAWPVDNPDVRDRATPSNARA